PDALTRPQGAADAPGPRLNVLDPAAPADILDTLRQARPASNDLPPSPPRSPAAPILRRATGPTPPSTNRPAHRATEHEEATTTTPHTTIRPVNAATASVSDMP